MVAKSPPSLLLKIKENVEKVLIRKGKRKWLQVKALSLTAKN